MTTAFFISIFTVLTIVGGAFFAFKLNRNFQLGLLGGALVGAFIHNLGASTFVSLIIMLFIANVITMFFNYDPDKNKKANKTYSHK